MQKNWYLRNEKQSEGPFSEPEIRARLLADAFTAGAEVKQGNSDWRPAAGVKQLFVQIYQEGWYVKTSGKTVGPFITRKIMELNNAGQLPKDALLRQGFSAYWLKVNEAIAMIEQKASLLSALPSICDKIDQTQQPGVPANEVEVDPIEIIEIIDVVPIVVEAIPVIVDAIPIVVEAIPVRPFVATPMRHPASTPFAKPVTAFPESGYFQPLSAYTPPRSLTLPRQKSSLDEKTWMLFWAIVITGGVLAAIGSLLALSGLIVLMIVLTVLAGIAGAFIMIAASIWQLVIAFQESTEEGLLNLFIPFYAFYYMITRWDRCWRPTLINGAGWIWQIFLIVPYMIGFLIFA